MKQNNRLLIVVKAKRPFVGWINSVAPDGEHLGLQEVRQDCTAYLLNGLSDARQIECFLREYWRAVFEYELWSWHGDEGVWPQDLSYELFRQWFDVAVHSEGRDSCESEPLTYEFCSQWFTSSQD